ncbi:MAG TPA: hypothetical protein VN962_24490 [Polyangia bacterium]|nr:hypothetical protein [Polyangia bacterium]
MATLAAIARREPLAGPDSLAGGGAASPVQARRVARKVNASVSSTTARMA